MRNIEDDFECFFLKSSHFPRICPFLLLTFLNCYLCYTTHASFSMFLTCSCYFYFSSRTFFAQLCSFSSQFLSHHLFYLQRPTWLLIKARCWWSSRRRLVALPFLSFSPSSSSSPEGKMDLLILVLLCSEWMFLCMVTLSWHPFLSAY